ncbi:MAG: hypothetical protein M3R02_12725 [Chloroflexota bacterium]|nr:hypothetical protein [Chloroflexota bacterium]
MKIFRHLTLTLALVATFVLGAVAVTPSDASAQQNANVGQLVSGLINVAVGNVQVNVGDITVQDVIDVENVLNDNEIRILNNVLNNNQVLSNNENIDILTNALRNANILTQNQVVVGVLSGGQIVFQNL